MAKNQGLERLCSMSLRLRSVARQSALFSNDVIIGQINIELFSKNGIAINWGLELIKLMFSVSSAQYFNEIDVEMAFSANLGPI